MQKWEYLELEHIQYWGEDREDREFSDTGLYVNGIELESGTYGFYDYLNGLGKEGWEMLSVHSFEEPASLTRMYYFKRPKE